MNDTHIPKLCMNTLQPVDKTKVNQEKGGETNTHEYGTSLNSVHPVVLLLISHEKGKR
jgi:hypothetical protein